MDYIPSNHHLTPPHTAEAKSVWLRLLRSRRVGISTFHRLLHEHGSAEAALEALPDIARASGVADYHICPQNVVDLELKAGRRAGASLVALGEPHYPSALSLIPDAPPLIWMKGDLSLLERPVIATVGARNASSIAMRMTRSVTRDLCSEGFAMTSNLAHGIAAMTHETALNTGTIAIMSGGIDIVDAGDNARLYSQIAEQGVLISEQAMGVKPNARHVSQCSRIVSGLALATIVIEASAKSNALTAATCAMEQGREVLAVPSHPFDGRASGCNNLLRDGACLMRGARDVIEALANAPPLADAEVSSKMQSEIHPEQLEEPTPRTFKDHTALHALILGRLGPAPISEDQLIRDIGARADQVGSELLSLELDGKVKRRAGGLLALV